ncbi:MAG: hypothetical protein U0988_12460, partial [Allopontixanthobacter sp.]|nr:hypothetical protein [Allopontixanthobacter sp.]
FDHLAICKPGRKARTWSGVTVESGEDGNLLRSRAAAAKQSRLSIEFADGALDAVPAGQAERVKSPAKARKSPSNAPQSRQDDLFG